MPRGRAVLAQRPGAAADPAQPPRVVPAAGPVPRWSGARALVLAFTQQVLLSPVRVGILVSLGGMIAVVVVGAERWWLVLGVVLFQTAAATLILCWVDVRSVSRRPGRGADGPADPSAQRAWVSAPHADVDVPRPRRPSPDEGPAG